jgi:hypothetical protein
MNVNWQNLATAIQSGQSAYDGGGFGNPIDYSSVGFYDHPMSDFSQSGALAYELRPEDFVVGISKWGRDQLITE